MQCNLNVAIIDDVHIRVNTIERYHSLNSQYLITRKLCNNTECIYNALNYRTAGKFGGFAFL